jgi:two-component system cell cycle sensor histidine kinase PleC
MGADAPADAEGRSTPAGLPGVAFRLVVADGALTLTAVGEDVRGLIGQPAAALMRDSSLLFQAFAADGRACLRAALTGSTDPIDIEVQTVAGAEGSRRLRVLARAAPFGACAVVWDGLLLDVAALRLGPSRDSLATAIEHAGDSIEITDTEFRLQYVNPAFETITGYSRAEVIGRTPGSLLRSGHFDDSYYETIERTIRAGRVWRGELITRRRDGEVRYQEATISPVTESAGTVTHYIAVKRDVTARRIAESALERARSSLADAIESISEGLAMFDVDDRLVLHNRRFLDVHAFLPQDRSLKGLRFEELLRQGIAAGAFADAAALADAEGWIDARLHQHRRAAEAAIEQRMADGRWLRVTERKTPSGGVVGVWTDITELKRREVAVLEAKEAAEVANRAKTTFLAHMSHELRTPLSAVLGFAELIAREINGPIGNERYLQYARDIHTAGEHLLGVIDGILDISRVEAGALELSSAPVDCAELIDVTTRLVREHAAKLGLTIEVSVPADLPRLQGDRRRLRQVLINLLSNAVKFTPAGGAIRVAAERDGGGLVLRVGDTGIGMAAAEIGEALTPFKRLDNELTRRHDGTGLGLPLAKTLVELHDGILEIDSAPGRGTTVACRFPPGRVCTDRA